MPGPGGQAEISLSSLRFGNRAEEEQDMEGPGLWEVGGASFMGSWLSVPEEPSARLSFVGMWGPPRGQEF